MPQGGRAVHTGPCPNDGCRGPLISMEWADGFGLESEVLEIHCSWCGLLLSPKGVVIRQSYKNEKELQGKER